MASSVTVGGGDNSSNVTLTYDATDRAYMQAQAFSSLITNQYASVPASVYGSSGPASPYLIIPSTSLGGTINVGGYAAVVVQDTGGQVTLTGGTNGQTVLGSDGGLSYTSTAGSATVVAGGGANYVSLAGTAGGEVDLGPGNDTVLGGDGPTTIEAGAGSNSIVAGAGATHVVSTGQDTVQAGSGSVTVLGSNTTPESLLYIGNGGGARDSVDGGIGSVTVYAAGGGQFTGGSAGSNVLITGTTSSSVTLTGGGNNDYLEGDAPGALLVAGNGLETLVAKVDGDTLAGSANSTASAQFQLYGADTVNLGSGAASIGFATQNGSAVVNGGSGNLLFVGSEAASTVNAGGGRDTIYANGGGGTFQSGTAGGSIIIGGTSAVTATGNGVNDYLEGNATVGGDTLISNNAGQTLVAKVSGDTLVGGGFAATYDIIGTDTVSLGSGAATVNLAEGAAASVTAGSGQLTFYNGHEGSTVAAGTGSDTIYANQGGGSFAGGSGGTNLLIGGSGVATLIGGGNNDYLEGNAIGGGDLLQQGGSATDSETLVANVTGDTLTGGVGKGTFILYGTDTVNLGSGQAIIGVQDNDTKSVHGAAFVSGGSATSQLLFLGGDTLASTISGGAGSDTVYAHGGGGNFKGGLAGNNVLIGGAGAVTLQGGGNGDYLEAGSGLATLIAGSGNETLVSGTSATTLYGGNGSDVFSLVKTDGQTITVAGFTAQDELYFKNQADANAATAAVQNQPGGGYTTIMLSDRTTIQVIGTSVTASQIGYVGKP